MVQLKAKPSNQHTVFKRDARALECDDSEAAFEKVLTTIGHANVGKNDVTPKQRGTKKKRAEAGAGCLGPA